MTLVGRGFRLLDRAMEPAAAESVRYIRGAVVISDALDAVLSNQQIEQITDGGAAIVGRQFSWRLKRSDLVLDSEEVAPQKFDKIEWAYGGRVYVFEVLPEAGLPESGAVDPRSNWIPASVKLVETR